MIDVVERRSPRRCRCRAVQRVVSDGRRAAERGRTEHHTRRHRREPGSRPHLEFRARQRRLHRTGGRDTARQRPERRTPSAVPRREPADALTYTQQRGVKSVQASAYGNTITYTPEDRAARALDGNPATAWRAASLGNAIGQAIRLQLNSPITTDHVNLVQPLNGPRNRWITKVELIFDGKSELSVPLDASSRTAAGSDHHVRSHVTSRHFEIKITDINDGPPQTVRRRRRRRASPRSDCATNTPIKTYRSTRSSRCRKTSSTRSAAQTASHPLILVMTRDALRPVPPRTDPEQSIARTFDLPDHPDVRADRQRQRQPKRLRRRDRRRTRSRTDGDRRRK